MHFVVLGAIVVAVHLATREATSSLPGKRIVVTDADVAWMLTAWQKKWQRPPTLEELRGLVESQIREEILYREAVALGLDRDDSIVRRRLAMKMEFLAKDFGAASEPTEAELRAFLDENRSRYEVGARRSFTHIYFSEDKRGARAEPEARALLAELRAAAEPPLKASERGDRFLLPFDYTLRSRREIVQQFGTAFADALFGLDVGPWQGPVRSGYGVHLVRVLEETPARVPPFADLRERIRNDLVEHRRRQSLEGYYRTLREKYEVEIAAQALQAGESDR